jgi:hypothetical protein
MFPAPPSHLLSSSVASAPIAYVPTLNERLDFLRKASDTVIFSLVDSISELWTCLPQDYLRDLGTLDRIICLRSSLVCWAVTQGKIVPREMQLCSILADQNLADCSLYLARRPCEEKGYHRRVSSQATAKKPSKWVYDTFWNSCCCYQRRHAPGLHLVVRKSSIHDIYHTHILIYL